MKQTVYVGCSLDGYIADRNGGLEWLQSVPNPDGDDFGWDEFMGRMDAIVMGRKTFETVCGFGGPWPYSKPVFVLSSTLEAIPEEYAGKAELVNGELDEILNTLNEKGYQALYIDGGSVIQSFLKEDLVDEIITTTIPILLGGGTPLFGTLPQHMMFDHVSTGVYIGQLVQSHYRRKR